MTPEEQKQKQLKKFKKLNEEWRTGRLGAQTPDLRKDILTAAMNIVQLKVAKSLDQDLANLREQVKVANQVYSEGEKENGLRIEFLIEVLRSRGEDVPEPEDFIRQAANGDATDSA